MKFGQLIKNHAENEAARLVPALFLISLKNFIQGKSKWSAT